MLSSPTPQQQRKTSATSEELSASATTLNELLEHFKLRGSQRLFSVIVKKKEQKNHSCKITAVVLFLSEEGKRDAL